LIAVIACIVAAGVVALVLGVRAKDLPPPELESPFLHLDERRTAIYENLRDLQFEYRVGKLSDIDYQNTKRDLQKELAGVLAAIDDLKAKIAGGASITAPVRIPPAAAPAPAPAAAPPPVDPVDDGLVCPSCGARFETELKFCGECGKPMKAVKA
jgi:hypothetical protein